MNLVKVKGLPGTGKTTKLFSMIEEYGLPYDGITLATYRKTVATSLKNSIPSSALDNNRNIGTLHAIALHNLRLAKGDYPVISPEDKFLFLFGKNWRERNKRERDIVDQAVSWYISHKTLKNYPGRTSLGDIKDETIINQAEAYTRFKEEHNLHDFDDMIRDCREEAISPESKTLIVDEFQDLNSSQYELFLLWADTMELVIIAGDPFQSIQRWAGGVPEFWNSLKGEEILLPESYRLRQPHIDYAWDIIKGQVPPEIKSARNPARYGSGLKNISMITTSEVPNYIAATRSASTLHLARAQHILTDVVGVPDIMEGLGIPYSTNMDGLGWSKEDAMLHNAVFQYKMKSYVEAAQKREEAFAVIKQFIEPGALDRDAQRNLKHDGGMSTWTAQLQSDRPYSRGFVFSEDSRRGRMLTAASKSLWGKLSLAEQNTQLMTIHAAKGLEADTVFLYDITTPRVLEEMRQDKRILEEEQRVWFVGATRVRENLIIVRPSKDEGSASGMLNANC